MNKIANATRKFLRNEEGATMVEYALLVALIAVVVIVAVQTLGTNASTKLQNAATAIGGASWSTYGTNTGAVAGAGAPVLRGD